MKVEKISQSTYDDYCLQMQQHHFLHSIDWSKSRIPFGWSYELIGFYENNELVAVANLRSKKVPKINQLYGYIPRGFVTDYHNFKQLKAISDALKKYGKKNKFFMIKIDPDLKRHTIDKHKNIIDGPNNYQLIEELAKMGYHHCGFVDNHEGNQPRYTFRINLRDRDFADIFANFEKNNRNKIMNSVKKGLYLVDGTRNDIPELVRLMNLNAKRSGFSIRTEDFYLALFDNYQPEKIDFKIVKIDYAVYQKNIDETNTKLLTEKKELEEKLAQQASKKLNNKLQTINNQLQNVQEDVKQLEQLKTDYPDGMNLAAGIFLKEGDKVWSVYSGRSYQYNNLVGGNFLTYEMIKHYHQQNFLFFDMFGTIGDLNKENPNYGHYLYKRSFGGEYLEFIGEFDLVVNKPLYKLYLYLTDPTKQKSLSKTLSSLIVRGSKNE